MKPLQKVVMALFHLLSLWMFYILSVSFYLLVSAADGVEGKGDFFYKTTISSHRLTKLNRSETFVASGLLKCAMKTHSRGWGNLFCYKDKQCSLYEFSSTDVAEARPMIIVDYCFVKPGLCPLPFVLVSEVGCILEGGGAGNITEAKTYCNSLGSELFTARSVQDINKVWGYLTGFYSIGGGWHFWIGIEGTKWLNGRLVDEWPPNQTPGNNTCGRLTSVGEIHVSPCVYGSTCLCKRDI